MNKTILILLTIIASTITNGQNVIVKTEKYDYKIDETIKLVFEVNAKVDSTSQIKGANFKVINGPRKNQSTSIVNGQTTLLYSLTYEIQAENPGKLEIITPTFYIDNKEHKAENLLLTISGTKLTNKEIEEINFNKFKDKPIKPDGTIRIVLSDNFGYIEEFKGFEWKFKRKLTKKEIAKLRKK